MNVTIKLDDALCKEARHRAVDANLSLSGWIANVVRERLAGRRKRKSTLLSLLGDPQSEGAALEIPVIKERPRAAELDD